MQKIRTRLKRPPENPTPVQSFSASSAWTSNFSAPTTRRPSVLSLAAFQRRLKHWPTLALAILGWISCALILTTVTPTQTQHLPFSNSYGPLLLAVWIATSFTVSFIFLNSRRGMTIGLLTTFWLSTQLQNIELNLWWWGAICLVFGLIEVGFVYYNTRAHS